MSIRISAVICTHNRVGYLSRAIASLVDQTLPREYYEILIVDNRSTDDTKRVVLDEFAHVSNLRYLYEPVLGLNPARNAGWTYATGQYVTYLDDDATAYPYWLENILDVFEIVKPRPGCVGGKIEPIWEAPRPPWLSDRMTYCLGALDWSNTPVVLKGNQWLGGGNLAFPRCLLEDAGGFEPGFGRVGNRLLSNEDLLIQHRLERKGYCRFYHPQISIRHYIPASRLTKRWFIRRAYWQGVSDAKLYIRLTSCSTSGRFRLGMRKTLDVLASEWLLTALLLPTGDSTDRFERKYLTFAEIGYIRGLLDETGQYR